MIFPCAAGLLVGAGGIALWRRLSLAEHGYRDYFLALIGIAIAYTMAFVGRSRRGPRLQIAALAITLGVLAIGQYVVVAALVGQRALQTGHPVPTWVGPGLFFRAWGQLFDGRDVLFFLAAVGCAAMVTRRRPAPSTPTL